MEINFESKPYEILSIQRAKKETPKYLYAAPNHPNIYGTMWLYGQQYEAVRTITSIISFFFSSLYEYSYSGLCVFCYTTRAEITPTAVAALHRIIPYRAANICSVMYGVNIYWRDSLANGTRATSIFVIISTYRAITIHIGKLYG